MDISCPSSLVSSVARLHLRHLDEHHATMNTPTFLTPSPINLHHHHRHQIHFHSLHRSSSSFFQPLPHRRTPQPTIHHPAPHKPLNASAAPPPPTPETNAPSPPDISFSTAASSAPTLTAALTDAASRALANLSPGGPPTLAIAFVSVRYCVSNVGPSGRDSLNLVVPRLRALIPALTSVIGCTVDGVIGAGPTSDVVELEDAPALSVTLARLPAISVRTFHVLPDDLPSPDARQAPWRSLLGMPPSAAHPPAFLILSDPSFAERGELTTFLEGVEYAYPGSALVGSLASAGAASAQGHMFCTLRRDVLSGDATSLHDSGLVGMSLTGDVQLDCLVSPGCRPIGPVFEVRKVGSGGVIREMEVVGRPSTLLSAVGHLKGVASYATPEERRLISRDLHIGVAIDQLATSDKSDDYLIRHVLHIGDNGGCIIVGQSIRPGQLVRFFIKERESAKATLDATMQKYKRTELVNSLVGYSNPPFGAMLFVDAGRGRALFQEPMMETRNLSWFAPGVPVAGLFGGGQIGPSRSGTEGVNEPSVVHNSANLIALVRRRSGVTPERKDDSDVPDADVEKDD